MDDLVTDEMVETAARAMYEDAMRRLGVSTPAPWEQAAHSTWLRFMGEARAALDTAAPLIAAAALRDAADREMAAWEPVLMSPDWVEAIESVCETLRAHADQIEKEDA